MEKIIKKLFNTLENLDCLLKKYKSKYKKKWNIKSEEEPSITF